MNPLRRRLYPLSAAQTVAAVPTPTPLWAYTPPNFITTDSSTTYPYPTIVAIPTPTNSDSSWAGDASPSSSTTTTSAVPIAHLEISTPSQVAVVVISVICGVLLLCLLFALCIIVGKKHEWQHLRIDVEGKPAGGGYHRRKHRSQNTETEFTEDLPRAGFAPVAGVGLGSGGRGGPNGGGGYPENGGVGNPNIARGGYGGFEGLSPFRAVPGGQTVPGMAAGYFPQAQSPNGGVARAQEGVREVEELSEVSSTNAEGTRVSRTGSSSKATNSHQRRRSRT